MTAQSLRERFSSQFPSAEAYAAFLEGQLDNAVNRLRVLEAQEKTYADKLEALYKAKWTETENIYKQMEQRLGDAARRYKFMRSEMPDGNALDKYIDSAMK